MAKKDEVKGHLRSRFKKSVDKAAEKYVASISFDWRLYKHDIAGSIAHAHMLAKQELISKKDAELIVSGLVSIRDEIEQGKFEFKPELEDIHMNIESRLFEKIGDVAGKLHTARSRNDQVALDMRLFVKEAISETISRLKDFQLVLLDIAEANKAVIMPGYTHLQQAQPVLFAHHLLAYFEMTQRDVIRFQDCLKRTDVLPLGSGALAGVAYPVDRNFIAQKLGFSEVSANSLDAVSDRDFVIEYEAAAAISMMHISRLAEEIVLWSSAEFGFVELDEAYATSSSIMPQKKNPDVAELARGKTGRVYGNLLSLLTIMKGLPLAYNRDMQEDKEGLFDTVDTLISTLEVFTGLIKTLKTNSARMEQPMTGSYILATDLADYLVKKGLPFRQAHSIVGKLVQYAIGKSKGFQELSLDEYRVFSPLFADDVYSITVKTSVQARNTVGGTAPAQVVAALSRAKKLIRARNEK
ncbi:MAG: argininosuccinate lyase [Chloroflexi bacterium RBG_19FT_COMBO_48_23]|nr:MAG: argininosuccinate lyase [Chloroflexi bacterium RBG_19FT_COMBO_48_23]